MKLITQGTGAAVASEFGELTELVDAGAARWPDRVYLQGRRTLTFGDLANESKRLARWFSNLGIGPGTRVAIAARTDADVVVAIFAACRAGATFVVLHEGIRPWSFSLIVNEVAPACLVLDDSTADLRILCPSPPLLCSGERPIAGAVSIAEAVRAGNDGGMSPAGIGAAASDDFGRADPACLIYTSGSTGMPRGVMASQRNIGFATAAIQSRLQYEPNDTLGLFLPLSFDYGLYQLFLALAAGASVYLGRFADAALRLGDELAEREISILPGVPSMLAALLGAVERSPAARLERLRMLTNTGDRLPEEIVVRLGQAFPNAAVFSMYGLTECKRVSIRLPEEAKAHPGSVGRPLDGTSVDVLGDDLLPVRDGHPGELFVRGPHVTMGYWRAPDETRTKFIRQGDGGVVLRTGDTFRRDQDGFLYFLGRSDDQAKRHGFRFSVLEVEAAAMTIPGASATACVRGTDGTIDLYVVGERLSSRGVLARLRETMEPYKVPDRVSIVDQLPTTAHGKYDRALLTALAAEGRS